MHRTRFFSCKSQIGRRLGVRHVLEGSVRKASGKVRIARRLIDAVTGAHIWADRFERDLTDVFALQDEVTVAVVSAIQPKLLQTEIAMATGGDRRTSPPMISVSDPCNNIA
jgi:adenylate cyclase